MIKSFAKVNLVLDLVKKRDDGFHEVDYVMQEVSLFDKILIRECNELEINCNDPNVPLNESNSCFKAVKLLQEFSGIEQNVSIDINKSIPSAAGLGGGTSNAAVVLKFLNDKWKLNLSIEELTNLARKIGLDTCFFIRGKTCHVMERGEAVFPIKSVPKTHLLLITPEIAVPDNKTKWMFSKVNVNSFFHPSCNKMIQAIQNQNIEEIANSMGNVFEQLDLAEYAPVFQLIQELKQKSLNAILAGSGPSVFAVFDSKNSALSVFNDFKNRFSNCFLIETV